MLHASYEVSVRFLASHWAEFFTDTFVTHSFHFCCVQFIDMGDKYILIKRQSKKRVEMNYL